MAQLQVDEDGTIGDQVSNEINQMFNEFEVEEKPPKAAENEFGEGHCYRLPERKGGFYFKEIND